MFLTQYPFKPAADEFDLKHPPREADSDRSAGSRTISWLPRALSIIITPKAFDH